MFDSIHFYLNFKKRDTVYHCISFHSCDIPFHLNYIEFPFDTIPHMTYHLIKMNSIFMYYLMTFDSDIMTYERKKTLSWRHIDINYLNEHKMYQIPYSLIICFLFFYISQSILLK